MRPQMLLKQFMTQKQAMIVQVIECELTNTMVTMLLKQQDCMEFEDFERYDVDDDQCVVERKREREREKVVLWRRRAEQNYPWEFITTRKSRTRFSDLTIKEDLEKRLMSFKKRSVWTVISNGSRNRILNKVDGESTSNLIDFGF